VVSLGTWNPDGPGSGSLAASGGVQVRRFTVEFRILGWVAYRAVPNITHCQLRESYLVSVLFCQAANDFAGGAPEYLPRRNPVSEVRLNPRSSTCPTRSTTDSQAGKHRDSSNRFWVPSRCEGDRAARIEALTDHLRESVGRNLTMRDLKAWRMVLSVLSAIGTTR
jgi:hypothetical protein